MGLLVNNNPYSQVKDPLELARLMHQMVISHEGFAWAGMMQAGADMLVRLDSEIKHITIEGRLAATEKPAQQPTKAPRKRIALD